MKIESNFFQFKLGCTLVLASFACPLVPFALRRQDPWAMHHIHIHAWQAKLIICILIKNIHFIVWICLHSVDGIWRSSGTETNRSSQNLKAIIEGKRNNNSNQSFFLVYILASKDWNTWYPNQNIKQNKTNINNLNNSLKPTHFLVKVPKR